MHLKNGTWVVVCDSGKYLLLENHGNEDIMDLSVVAHDEAEHLSTGDQGTDRPGRFGSIGERRGAAEMTDWHELGKRRFALSLADRLDGWAKTDQFNELVIVADKSTLGILRGAISEHVERRVVGEIGGDYAHRTIAVMESVLTAA